MVVRSSIQIVEHVLKDQAQVIDVQDPGEYIDDADDHDDQEEEVDAAPVKASSLKVFDHVIAELYYCYKNMISRTVMKFAFLMKKRLVMRRQICLSHNCIIIGLLYLSLHEYLFEIEVGFEPGEAVNLLDSQAQQLMQNQYLSHWRQVDDIHLRTNIIYTNICAILKSIFVNSGQINFKLNHIKLKLLLN